MATRAWTITQQNDFQTHTDWAAGTGATVANDAVNHVIGDSSVKLTVDDSDSVRYMSNNISFNVQSGIGITFYIDAADLTNFSNIEFRLCEATGTTVGYRCAIYKGTIASSYARWPITSGWNTIWLSRSDFLALGSASPAWDASNPIFAVKKVSIGVQRVAAGTPSVSFGELMTVEPHKAVIMLAHDDITADHYTTAFPYLKARNLLGTCYAPSDWIGGVGRLTVLQLLEMQAAGWEIGAHSKDHVIFTALCTISEGIEAVDGEVVITVPEASNGLCTPFVVGEDVYCDFTATGGTLADGTYDILAKDANTVTIDLDFSATTQTVTISHPAATILANLTACDNTLRELGICSRSFAWPGLGSYCPTGLDIMRSIYSTCRGYGKGVLQKQINARLNSFDSFIPGDPWSTAYSGLNDANIATATSVLAEVVAAKGATSFYAHDIGVGISLANYQTFVGLVLGYVQAGLLDVVTPSIWKAWTGMMVDSTGRPRAYSGTLPEAMINQETLSHWYQ